MTDRAQLSFAPASGGLRLQTPDVSSLLSTIGTIPQGPRMASLLSAMITDVYKGPGMSSLLSTIGTIPQGPHMSSLLSAMITDVYKGPGMSSLLSTIGTIPQGPHMSSLLSTMITDVYKGPGISSLLSTMITDDLLNSLTGADSTRSTTGFSLEADGHGARLPSHIAAESGCLTAADAALLRAFIVIIAALWLIQLHLEGNELLRFLQDRVDDVALAVLLTSSLLRLLRLDRPR
jgi:hypothetical protein